MTQRSINFCSGPAALPTEVLEKAQAEMLDFRASGSSVMEMSHRSPLFMEVAAKAVADFRKLMKIPDNYKVLYMQGGATHQFSCVPWNLLGHNPNADFIDTGIWSQKAIKEAGRISGSSVHIAGSLSDKNGVSRLPGQSSITIRPETAYLHYTPNETISGLEFSYIPNSGDVPLVADMSSCILSREYDVSKFGIIYAGAQKNIGPAGITWIVIRDDLLEQYRDDTPALMKYTSVAEQDSMLNTPPTYALYLCGLVFEWMLSKGGVPYFEAQNMAKADLLYKVIDHNPLYQNTVHPDSRSRMNVTFGMRSPETEAKFLSESERLGMVNLKGHRAVGGIRASIYNQMTLEQVGKLATFMEDFAKNER